VDGGWIPGQPRPIDFIEVLFQQVDGGRIHG